MIDNSHICSVWWTSVLTNDRYSNEYKIVLHYSLICFYRLMKQTAFTGYSRIFAWTFRYIDDVLLVNISRFGLYLYLIYPTELEVKDTNDSHMSAFLPWHLSWNQQEGRRLKTKLYDKQNSFTFLIVNFPFICSNISAPPEYAVYTFQNMRFLMGLVLSTVLFCTDLSCWKKTAKKATIVIMNRLTITKYPFLKW